MKTTLCCRFLLNSWELISRFCKTFTLNCLQKKTPGTGKEHSMFTWFKSGNHITLVYTEFFRKLNKMTLKSFLVIHVVCSFAWFILVLVYRVLVLTVRQYNMRHKIALWVKPQFTRHPSKPDISSSPKGVRFRGVPLHHQMQRKLLCEVFKQCTQVVHGVSQWLYGDRLFELYLKQISYALSLA